MLPKKNFALLLASYLTLTVGCRTYSPPAVGASGMALDQRSVTANRPVQTPLVREIKAASPLTSIEKGGLTGEITLQQVLALTLMQNPQLAAFSEEIRAREAALLQAGLLPNPQLQIRGQSLANSALKGVDGSSTTIELSQLILLGGERTNRIIAAGLTRDLARWDYETKRIDVLTQASQFFTALLSAQEKLALAQQLMRLAQQVVTTVSKRVQAGKISPVEETKAQVALSSVSIEFTRDKQELKAARKRLAAIWGSTTPHFRKAIGQLRKLPGTLPSLEQLTQLISQNPNLARWSTELAQREALIALAESQAIPDLTLSVGGTQYANTGDYALVAGISIPIPLFDRNQGGILEAQRRLTKAKEAHHAVEVELITQLSTAYQRLASAYAEATTLKAKVLPNAQRAFDAASQGFRLGKFGFLSVLDSQRTLFNAKSQYLRALTDYHQAVAEIERLIGERLGAANNLKELTP